MIGDIITGFSAVSFEGLAVLLREHQLFVSVIVPFFAGEFSVHLFGILYGLGDISLWPAVIATASMVFFDVVIYATMRMLQRSDKVLNRVNKVRFFTKIRLFFEKHQKKYGNNPILLFILVKLMPMTKVTLIFYAFWQKMSLVRFVIQDAIITAIWVSIIFLPGWLVGKEVLTEEAGRRVSVFIIYFLVLIVLLLLFGNKIDTLLMRAIDSVARAVNNHRRVK